MTRIDGFAFQLAYGYHVKRFSPDGAGRTVNPVDFSDRRAFPAPPEHLDA